MSYKMFETVLLSLGILIQTYIIYWLLKLENIGCACSYDWRRQFILFYCFFSLIMAAFTLMNESRLLVRLSLASLVLGILNIVFTLQYVWKLKKEKCECSSSLAREVIWLAAWLNVALVIFAIVYSLFWGGVLIKNRRA